jgi:hypothetical protein
MKVRWTHCLLATLLCAGSALADTPYAPLVQQPADKPTLGAGAKYTEQLPPKPEGGALRPTALSMPSTDLSGIGTGQLPEDVAFKVMTSVRNLPEGNEREGNWAPQVLPWRASGNFSHPLYFEDIMLEHHGQQRYPCLQPMISGARFFATIPALPYLMTVQDPFDCNYLLGGYRPGTCAPALFQRPPYQRDAVIVEGAAIAGGILAIP